MKIFSTIFMYLSFCFSVFSQNSSFKITTLPAELGLNKFYKKYPDASGIPIVSSWCVPDEAIVKVAQMKEFFLN